MTTLDQYQKMLRTNKLRLDDELEIQAEMQYEIGAEVARLNSKMIEAKDTLARTEAELLEEYKRLNDKLTVDQAKGRVLTHQDRRKKWAVYQELREAHELWEAMLSAWIVKGYKMADLGTLFSADYFAITTVSGSSRREPSRADEERRTAVREASTDTSRRRRAL